MTTLREAFDRKASEWEAYTQTPAGRLREELNYRYLQPHLPPPPAIILDAGCGTGKLGLRLAERGYTIHLLDLSEQMLAIARQKAEETGLTRQMQFYPHDIAELDLPGSYDMVICHTLLEYTPDVTGTLQKIASLLRTGGILSLVFVNRHADVLKQVLSKGDLKAARLPPVLAIDCILSSCKFLYFDIKNLRYIQKLSYAFK